MENRYHGNPEPREAPQWVHTLRSIDEIWSSRPGKMESQAIQDQLNIALYDACSSIRIKDPRLKKYAGDVSMTLFLLLVDAVRHYDPAHTPGADSREAVQAEPSGLVRYVRSQLRYKLNDACRQVYRDFSLDGSGGMEGFTYVKDEQGNYVVDEATGKTLVRAKYSRKDAPGQVLGGFSLDQTLTDEDSAATKGDFVSDQTDGPEVRMAQEETQAMLWNMAAGVILDFQNSKKKQSLRHGMCYTERTAYYAVSSPFEEFCAPLVKKYEENILHALSREYLNFFSTLPEEQLLTLENLYDLQLKREQDVLEDAGREDPLKFKKDGWLEAKVPRAYLKQATGKMPVASEITRYREEYLELLQSRLTQL